MVASGNPWIGYMRITQASCRAPAIGNTRYRTLRPNLNTPVITIIIIVIYKRKFRNRCGYVIHIFEAYIIKIKIITLLISLWLRIKNNSIIIIIRRKTKGKYLPGSANINPLLQYNYLFTTTRDSQKINIP